MAQWDQRDPRWQVKELGRSGSNVNGWHWEEKSKMSWARSRLQSLMQDIEASIKPEDGTAKVTGVKDLSGDVNFLSFASRGCHAYTAYLTRRKGNKTLVVYDLELTLQWQGRLAGEETDISGTMQVTEFTLGSDEDDYIMSVTSEKEEEKYSCLVDAIKRLQPAIAKLLLQFDEEIKTLEQ